MAQTINAQVEQYLTDYFTADAIKKYHEDLVCDTTVFPAYNGWRASYTEKYAVFSPGLVALEGKIIIEGKPYPYDCGLLMTLAVNTCLA